MVWQRRKKSVFWVIVAALITLSSILLPLDKVETALKQYSQKITEARIRKWLGTLGVIIFLINGYNNYTAKRELSDTQYKTKEELYTTKSHLQETQDKLD